jgi:putative oxidoreductase
MTTTPTTDIAALSLRLGSGILFLAHGLMKVFTFTIPGTVGYFESLDLPAIAAYLPILAELGGGVLLILGLATRLVSLPLIAVLLGAVWVHGGNGWTFSNPNGGWEFPLFWALIQTTIAVLGAGAYRLRIPAVQRALGAFA